jgi:hypothetical protein
MAATSQFQAQKIQIRIAPNSNIKIGSIVEIMSQNDLPQESANEYKKISGRWMVVEIDHTMTGTLGYVMNVTLVRNSLHYNPEDAQAPLAVFGKLDEKVNK